MTEEEERKEKQPHSQLPLIHLTKIQAIRAAGKTIDINAQRVVLGLPETDGG